MDKGAAEEDEVDVTPETKAIDAETTQPVKDVKVEETVSQKLRSYLPSEARRAHPKFAQAQVEEAQTVILKIQRLLATRFRSCNCSCCGHSVDRLPPAPVYSPVCTNLCILSTKLNAVVPCLFR